MYEIGKTFEFCAAQRLDNMPPGHPCRAQHGHTYSVMVALRKEELDQYDMVLDYHALAPIKRYIDTQLDHGDLNEIFDFPPTAENLARELFYRFRGLLADNNVAGHLLASVTVQESPKTFATYWEE